MIQYIKRLAFQQWLGTVRERWRAQAQHTEVLQLVQSNLRAEKDEHKQALQFELGDKLRMAAKEEELQLECERANETMAAQTHALASAAAEHARLQQ